MTVSAKSLHISIYFTYFHTDKYKTPMINLSSVAAHQNVAGSFNPINEQSVVILH